MDTRNSKVLADFVAYCEANPQQRFWQALRNWAGAGNWIYASNELLRGGTVRDTFYWEGKNE